MIPDGKHFPSRRMIVGPPTTLVGMTGKNGGKAIGLGFLLAAYWAVSLTPAAAGQKPSNGVIESALKISSHRFVEVLLQCLCIDPAWRRNRCGISVEAHRPQALSGKRDCLGRAYHSSTSSTRKRIAHEDLQMGVPSRKAGSNGDTRSARQAGN